MHDHKSFVAGTVKIQHLMKFITMKYGLNSESFVVDVIYKGDIIPQDYTLIDVAYYYKWEKDAPMQFFYRIFKKNKVLLKRRKRKSLCEDKISDPKKVKTLEVSNNVPNKGETTTKVNKINNKTETTKNGDKENENKKNEIVDGGRTVNNSPPSLVDETKKEVKKAVVEDKEPPAPPTLKPASEKMDTSEDEDDKPPSEKKLKIDLKPEISEVKKAEKVEVKVKVKEPKIESKQTAETKIATSKQIAESKQAAENKSVVKPVIPKLINTEKQKSNLKLNNIVNNLTKKLTESSSPPPPPPPTKPALTKPAIAKPPSSLLGGQTTITKKDKIESKEAKKEVPKVKQSNRDENTKGIPSATSVTLKTMKTPSTTSSSSTSGSSPNATVSFSNSFKSKNGSSMMDFVQPSNGLSSPTKKPGSSTLSDLRQFRKESAKTPSSMPKSPITPSLTSRTLTLGNTKKSSPSSSSPTTSSFSSTLTKPLPKPGEASLTNNLLAAQAQISALASLGLGLTDAQKLGLTDAQKEYIKTMAAAANMSSLASFFQPPVSLPPSQQLPSNRLKLTVSQKSPSANPLQMLPSLASHMAPESQWTKSFSPSHFVGTTSNGHSTASSSPKFSSSLSKTMMNQSIRQIPNPSLLTKQASEQQQLLQRAIASHVAAASASGSRLSQ